jgi:malonyl-CoA/methylmalonyl-CoA synthetase
MPSPTSPLTRVLAPSLHTKPCLRDAAGVRSYADVGDDALRVANALGEAGDARIAVLAPPGPAFLAGFFGVLAAGGCVVVLSPLHPPPETKYFCDDAEVRTILVSRELAHGIGPLASARRVLVIEDCLDAGAPGRVQVDPRGDRPALQLYTSGTTGKPKGAVITHANLAVQQDLLGAAWGWSSEDVLLHALPLHHLHGLGIALLTALGAGASAHVLPAFDARRVWEAMGQATVLMGVPTMYTRLFEAFDAADAATRARWTKNACGLRLATSGSAALPVSLGERWRSVTGTYPLERFGMTEIGVGMTNPLGGERRPGTVGMPLPTVETRVRDDGELWIRGPSVFSGYWNRDEATRGAFDDGWFKTGDTVARDADGYFKILGRTSVDILKSGGYKLSALEIEEVLREHGCVAEVAVVGVPDATWGERVVACVVPRAGREAELTEEGLRAFAKERLAAYKVPKNVLAFDELPRNAVGKVLKPELLRKVVARG